MPAPLKTFIIYAREDREALEKLKKHLIPLARRVGMEVWYDGEIVPGQEWKKAIKKNLEQAEIILLLLSSDFFASEYIEKEELKDALERHAQGLSTVVPVVVHYCDWESHPEIERLQVLPDDAQPAYSRSWYSPEEAFFNVAQGIGRIIAARLNVDANSSVNKQTILTEETDTTERARNRKDEAFWKKLLEAVEKKQEPLHRIELFNSYLENKDFQNHRDEAKDAIEEIEAEIEAEKTLNFNQRKRNFNLKYKEALAFEQNNNYEQAKIAFEETLQFHEVGFETTTKEIRQKIADCKRAEENLKGLPEMIFVKSGSFMMGSDEEYREKPIHSVTLSDFYIGKYPVTQKLWTEIMGSNPSHFKGCDDCPVESVSWEEVQVFLEKLNQRSPGKKYRLPTEAEWEFAARGGTLSKGYQFAGSNSLDEVGWYDSNSRNKTHPVGQKKPNELGIYDMSGNVWEWCADWYGAYPSDPQLDTTGPKEGASRVSRGGSFFHAAQYCRSAYRYYGGPAGRNRILGLRLVWSPQSVG